MIIKLIKTLIPFILVVMFSSCSNADYVDFVGESANWSAELNVTHISDSETSDLTLTYTGEVNDDFLAWYELTSLKGESSGDFKITEDNKQMKTDFKCSGCATISADDALILKIKWDDKYVERITLKK